MMPPPLVFIVNPVAGSHKNKKHIISLIQNRFDSAQAEIYFTKSKSDATVAARQAAKQGAEIVVAVGGDGTVNEVASGLVGSQAALGIIPRGSGNGLARALSIPMKPEEALSVIERGKATQIDMGRAAHRYFCAVAGIGFDARVSEVFAMSKVRGLISYILIVLTELRKYTPPSCELEFESKRVKCKPFLISVANTPQYGNGAIIAPKAKMDDGYFDLCLARQLSLGQMITAVPRLFRGTLDQHSGFEYSQVREVTFRSDQPIRFHVDGEPEKTDTTLKIEVIPRALKVRVP